VQLAATRSSICSAVAILFALRALRVALGLLALRPLLAIAILLIAVGLLVLLLALLVITVRHLVLLLRAMFAVDVPAVFSLVSR
jgi:hypothetical protein